MSKPLLVEAVLSDLAQLGRSPLQALRHLLSEGPVCGLCPRRHMNRAWLIDAFVAGEIFGEQVSDCSFLHFHWLSTHLHEMQQGFLEALLRRVVASKVNELCTMAEPDEARRLVLLALGTHPDGRLAAALGCASLGAGLLWKRVSGHGALDGLPPDVLRRVLRPCLRPALLDAGLVLKRARALDADVLGQREGLQKRARVLEVAQVAAHA